MALLFPQLYTISSMFSEYPVQIGKDSSGIDSEVNVHVMNGEGHMFS